MGDESRLRMRCLWPILFREQESVPHVMTSIRRHFTPNCMVFLTLVCADRQRWLASTAAKARLLALLISLRVQCHAWVILDDHLHLLITDHGGDVSGMVQRLKLRFVRGDPNRPQRVRVWQRRF